MSAVRRANPFLSALAAAVKHWAGMESVSYPDKLLKFHPRLAPADSVVTGTMPAAVLGVYFAGTRRAVLVCFVGRTSWLLGVLVGGLVWEC